MERKLVGEVARLTAEAAALQLFAQEYMVKAAHEKRRVRTCQFRGNSNLTSFT